MDTPRTATFYTHVADAERFACRLIRTVYATGTPLLVLCPDAASCARLSEILWVYEANSFIAHEIHRPGAVFPEHAPVVLVSALPEHSCFTTVLNLSETLCTDPYITRVLEIVGAHEDQLAAARTRFSAYRQVAFTLEHHKMQHH